MRVQTLPNPARESGAGAEWRRSWPVPAVSAVALGVSTIPIYSLGALMPSIHASTGWTRSQISTGPTLISVCTVLLSPLIGSAIDRFGSRQVGLPGIAFYCAAVATIAFSGPSIHTWWLTWFLVAIAYASVKMTVWTAAVVTLFKRGRGLALGLTLSGLGLGSSTLPYLTTLLQEHYGWRGAYLWLAGGGFALAVPLLWFFFFDAEDQARTSRRVLDHNKLTGTAPRVAFLSRRYLQMAGACFFAAVPSTAFVVHFVPIVRANGLSAHSAAATAGVIGICAIVGRLSGGFLLDRFSGPMIGFVSCALPVLSGPVLLWNHSASAAAFAAAMIGLSAGSEIGVLAYLVPRYFGLRHFGLLFGVMNGLITFGLGLGPVFAGYLFDRTGSYRHFLLLSVPLFAVSAILLGTLGEPASDGGRTTAPPESGRILG